MTGKVHFWHDKDNYGFITGSDKLEYYFNTTQYGKARVNDLVEFEPTRVQMGLKATEVRLVTRPPKAASDIDWGGMPKCYKPKECEK